MSASPEKPSPSADTDRKARSPASGAARKYPVRPLGLLAAALLVAVLFTKVLRPAPEPPAARSATAATAPATPVQVTTAPVSTRPESRNVETEASALAAPVAKTVASAPSSRHEATASAPTPGKAASLEARGSKMKIQQITSPGGIKAWLVEEHSVPLLALRFAFAGGSAQDRDGKEGTSNFLTGMMDEGAGDLDARAFQESMEEIAMRMSFEDGRDYLYGNFETLTVNRARAVDLLTLALNRPRFDTDAIERVRKQLLANIAYGAKNPDRVASREWSRTAFPNHPYGRPSEGTSESVSAISADDLRAFHKRAFARETLNVVAVGDITAADFAQLLDQVFGKLPANAELTTVSKIAPAGGVQRVVEMDVPQSVAVFGSAGIARKDPDFIPAFVVNQILGGGGFASRLMEEVREKRGLAYSVYSYLQPMQASAFFAGGVSTKNSEIGQSLDVIRAELKKMATDGPTPAELDNAKGYLVGSYALRFDTNAKIASQLLAIKQDDLGIDYVDKRNDQIKAVTLADVKRAAQRLLKTDDLVVTIVGKPTNLTKQ